MRVLRTFSSKLTTLPFSTTKNNFWAHQDYKVIINWKEEMKERIKKRKKENWRRNGNKKMNHSHLCYEFFFQELRKQVGNEKKKNERGLDITMVIKELMSVWVVYFIYYLTWARLVIVKKIRISVDTFVGKRKITKLFFQGNVTCRTKHKKENHIWVCSFMYLCTCKAIIVNFIGKINL